MFLYMLLWWWPQVHNELKEYEKKSNFKLFMVMKFMFKTIVNYVLLSIISNDMFWSQLEFYT